MVTGVPTIIPVDTKSVYGIDTANFHDFVILNGGLRYDDYDVSATKAGSTVAATSGLVNYNGGITLKPVPFGSLLLCRLWRRPRRSRSAPSSTAHRRPTAASTRPRR